MGDFSESLAHAAGDIAFEISNGACHTTISQCPSTYAKGGKQSSFMTEYVGGRYVSGCGKNIILPFFFAHCCTAREEKLTNWPTLVYSPRGGGIH